MLRVKIIFILALSFVLPNSAAATTLTEFVAISFSGPSSIMSLAPFDHTRGTLDSVGVSIIGEISVMVQTIPLHDEYGHPIPVPFMVSLDQDFFGLPSDSFFSFEYPATFVFYGIGSGMGETQLLATPFSYGFHFDSAIGFTGVSSSGPFTPPGLAYGTLAGFTDTFSPVMLELMLTSPGVMDHAAGVSFSSYGAILVEYDYTPASVPEPGTLLLLGAGLVSVAVSRRRKGPALSRK